MQKLKKGDTILIIAPAGAVTKKEISFTLQLIEKNGWKYEIGRNTFQKYSFGYNYSGTPEQRLEDLQWALDHPLAKAIWFARGGYGGVQIVDFIDLVQFKKNPKWLIGFSDNTVFHQHFNKRGFPTIHATVCRSVGKGYSEETYKTLIEVLLGQDLKYEIPFSSFNQLGEAEGILTGGNLSILYSLIGSSSFDNIENKVLFIEDLSENFYHVDRMLIGLERAGAFKGIKALIVGGFTNMGTVSENPNYNQPFDQLTYQIISERFKKYQIPQIFGFPSGHIFDNRALIMGAKIHLSVTKAKVQLTNFKPSFS